MGLHPLAGDHQGKIRPGGGGDEFLQDPGGGIAADAPPVRVLSPGFRLLEKDALSPMQMVQAQVFQLVLQGTALDFLRIQGVYQDIIAALFIGHHRRPRRPVGEGKEADAEIIPHPASAPAGLSERPRWP